MANEAAARQAARQPANRRVARARSGVPSREWLEQRLRLADLLTEAAELEHALLCKYLFAALSLKRETWEGGVTWQQLELVREWETNLLLIARQEMEHLALVCNLLTVVGESPYLRRPNFPVSGRYFPIGIECVLEPIGRDALRRFIEFEMPVNPDKRRLARIGIAFNRERHGSIGRLYREIERLFRQLAAGPLFVGPPAAQVATSSNPRGVTLDLGPSYQVSLTAITSLTSATKVIAQIIEEGEGSRKKHDPGHFGRLCQIYGEYEAETRKSRGAFSPARPLAHDPTAGRHDTSSLEGIALDLVELFDLAYETLILLLIRFFAHSHERPEEVNTLQATAFFPMMTAVIRPLAEIITLGQRLPAAIGWPVRDSCSIASRAARAPPVGRCDDRRSPRIARGESAGVRTEHGAQGSPTKGRSHGRRCARRTSDPAFS